MMNEFVNEISEEKIEKVLRISTYSHIENYSYNLPRRASVEE